MMQKTETVVLLTAERAVMCRSTVFCKIKVILPQPRPAFFSNDVVSCSGPVCLHSVICKISVKKSETVPSTSVLCRRRRLFRSFYAQKHTVQLVKAYLLTW